MRAVRLVLAGAALAVAAAAVTLGVLPPRWPAAPVLAALAALGLGLAALLTPVGRHRGRKGAHARPPLLDQARAAAAEHAAERAEQAATRAVIDPARPAPPAPEPRAPDPAAPAVAGRLPHQAATTDAATFRPRPPPWREQAELAEQAAVALAIATVYAAAARAGKIPVYATGRHEHETEEAKR